MLADLCRQGLFVGEGHSPTAFLRARGLGVCQPCVEGKLRCMSQPPRKLQLVRKLHRIHINPRDLPKACFSTAMDEATRHATVDVLSKATQLGR
jgi:hypothetical protein